MCVHVCGSPGERRHPAVLQHSFHHRYHHLNWSWRPVSGVVTHLNPPHHPGDCYRNVRCAPAAGAAHELWGRSVVVLLPTIVCVLQETFIKTSLLHILINVCFADFVFLSCIFFRGLNFSWMFCLQMLYLFFVQHIAFLYSIYQVKKSVHAIAFDFCRFTLTLSLWREIQFICDISCCFICVPSNFFCLFRKLCLLCMDTH